VSLHVPTFFGFFKSVDLHVPTYFCEFLYAKGMLNAKKSFLQYAATVQSTWGIEECKSRKYFYDFFAMQAGKC
jgi:hypothetical protein